MRKGIVMSQTVLVVLAAMTMLILLIVMYQVGVAQETQTPEQLCKLSVESRALVKAGTTSTIIPLNCKRDQEFFDKQEDIEINDKILNHALDCMYQFGEGKVDFEEGGNFFNGEFCAVCTTFEFIKDSKSYKSYNKGSFQKYISEQQRQKGQSYKQFFDESKLQKTESEGQTKNIGLYIDMEETIDPQKKHILFFKFTPKSTLETIGQEWVNAFDTDIVPSVYLEEYPGLDPKQTEFGKCKKLLN